jgi:hypothetical protein
MDSDWLLNILASTHMPDLDPMARIFALLAKPATSSYYRVCPLAPLGLCHSNAAFSGMLSADLQMVYDSSVNKDVSPLEGK